MKEFWITFIEHNKKIILYICIQTLIFSQAKYFIDVYDKDTSTLAITAFVYKLFFNFQCIVESFFTVVVSFIVAIVFSRFVITSRVNLFLLLTIATLISLLFFSPSLITFIQRLLGFRLHQ